MLVLMEERRENKKREKGLERMEVGLNTSRSQAIPISLFGLSIRGCGGNVSHVRCSAYCGSCLYDYRLVIRMK